MIDKIAPSSSYNRSKLMTRLYMLVFFGTLIYAFLAAYIGIYTDKYIYLSFLLFAVGNIMIIRRGYIELSKIIGLFMFNIMIFLVAASEPFTTGMHLHFVSAGAVALAIYGYQQWKGSMVFVLISLILSIMNFKTNISFLPWREFSVEQAQVFFILNTLIAASVSVYTILLISKFYYDGEKHLLQNEKTILVQNEQLLKTNEELDRFVYSASHDLRAPLSTLSGLINLSQMEDNNNTRNKYFELMKSRIDSMEKFIEEIIDYSKNSRLDVKNKSVQIKALFETIIDDLEFITGRKDVLINLDLEDELLVQSDETRLKMVFTNLISNGIKYRDSTKKKQLLSITAKTIDQKLSVMVEDNGIGISKQLHDQVFNMFFRAHEDSIGSGLGLYIVKESLDKLNGSISVESEELVGSKFTVILPIT